MRNFNIEAVFGGLLALIVLGVAGYAIATTNFGSAPGGGGTVVAPPAVIGGGAPTLTATSGQDLICECYDDAFQLAGKVKVVSPEYRTGFEQCRARAGVSGGDAWTAGWNARLSARPYESSCRAYKRRAG